MYRRVSLVSVLVLAFAAGVFAQQSTKTFTLSKRSSKDVATTPRIVRNGFEHVWLTAWRKEGAPDKILGRIVNSDGTLKKTKKLISGVSAFEQSFDVFYDSVNYTYLIAYETGTGLLVQLFDGNLAKVGSESLIEAGVSDTVPRLSFDPVNKRFLIFWFSTKDGVPRSVLKSRLLDVTGAPIAEEHSLVTAPAGKTYASLSVSTNQKTGNLLALVLLTDGTNGSLLGYRIKPDATLLRSRAKVFQPSTLGLIAAADASFSDEGTGFGFWSDQTSIKYRKISKRLRLPSSTQQIIDVAEENSAQTSMVFDSRNNQFVGVWAESKKIMAIVLSPEGTILKEPFEVTTISTTASDARNVATSYDPQQANVIVVWDEDTEDLTGGGERFKARAAIFGMGGSGTSGAVSIGDNFFSPSSLTVGAGTTVTWTQNGNNQHTVTADDGSFDSGTLNKGAVFQRTFTQAGTFSYHCTIHGLIMSGTITVTDSEPPPHY